MSLIPFHTPYIHKKSLDYVSDAIKTGKSSGDGPYTALCREWFYENLAIERSLLTTSCTHALEMAFILAEIGPGDEVIMPSFTFSSTATAALLRGASLVFVDVDDQTLNISPEAIEAAVTPNTRAIVAVHYGGVSCDLDKIERICQQSNVLLVEDAAQALLSTHKCRPLGSVGDFGAISFHETKNVSCGEGGLFICKEDTHFRRAMIVREKGTDRTAFLHGLVDKYTWQDRGSSYLPSDILAAVLLAQLEYANILTKHRLELWNRYSENLTELEQSFEVKLPYVPPYAKHNAHIFHLRVPSAKIRRELLMFLKNQDIVACPHYEPLHSSPAGKKYGSFRGRDLSTTQSSETLVRLPLYHEMNISQVDYVCEKIMGYFRQPEFRGNS